MPESRRSLHLRIATVAALLGLQLASCAAVQSGPDQAPPGILDPGALNRPSAPSPQPAPGMRPGATPLPLTGGPQIACCCRFRGGRARRRCRSAMVS